MVSQKKEILDYIYESQFDNLVINESFQSNFLRSLAKKIKDSESKRVKSENTSQKENIAAAVADYGLCINEDMPSSVQLRVRVVGYVNKNMVVSSGRGTPDSPFVLK